MDEVRAVTLLAPQMGGFDGISEVGRQVARAIAASGVPVAVCSLHDATRPDALGGLPVEFHAAAGSRARFVASVLTRTPAPEPALVFALHVHLLPAALPASAMGARVGVWLHGIEAWAPLGALRRRALRSARLVSGSAHTLARFAAANPGVATGPATVCPPAVPDLAPPVEADLAPDYALSVGRMSARERYKGHDALLEAWPAVLARVPGARLVVVGEGDDRARLEGRAAALGVAASVTFRGAVAPARLAALYRDAACLVLPSRDEGFGLVYLEAMRAGVPCVVSPGAATEIVADGETGLVVPYGEAPPLAAALVRLLGDAGLRRTLGGRARDVVAARFGFEAFARRLRAALGLPEAAC